MISKETMRVVLTAAKLHLAHWTRISCMLQEQIRRDWAGEKMPVFGRSVRPQEELQDADQRIKDIQNAIVELRDTEVGAEVWKELDSA